MNIVVLSSRYPTNEQPYSHMFVHTRNKEYIAKGHSVTVLVPSLNEYKYEIDGVNVIKSNVSLFKNIIFHADGVMVHLLMHRFSNKTDGGQLYDFIQQNNVPCVFYIHGVECQKIWRSRRDDIKLFSPQSFARFLYRDFYLIRKMQNTLRQFCREDSRSAFITPSKWMSQESILSTGIDTSKKTSIIPNGIDTKKFKFNCHWQNRDKALSIRPLYEKGKYGVDLMISVAKKLQEESIEFSLYGDGPDKELIAKRVNDLDAFNLNVGFLKSEHIPFVHNRFGVYLGVTRMDAQGVSMCEAMASGLPVISYDTCAIPEFIHHKKTGMLAPAYNVDVYSDMLLEVHSNKNLYTALAESGRRFVEEIDITLTTEQELKLLKDL